MKVRLYISMLAPDTEVVSNFSISNKYISSASPEKQKYVPYPFSLLNSVITLKNVDGLAFDFLVFNLVYPLAPSDPSCLCICVM